MAKAEEAIPVEDDAELQEIHNFDFPRAALLMQIMEKVATVAPKATSILGVAQAELNMMNEHAKEIARARADRAKEAELQRMAAEKDRLNAEAEGRAAEEKARAEGAHAAQERPPIRPQPPQQPGQPLPERRV